MGDDDPGFCKPCADSKGWLTPVSEGDDACDFGHDQSEQNDSDSTNSPVFA